MRQIGSCLLGCFVIACLATDASAQRHTDDPEVAMRAADRGGTDVLGAIGDSMKLLMIEHGTRIAFQEKTRRELGGPFWSDYHRSVRWPRQWDDTDSWWVNYLGHPVHGAAAGMIWLDHGAHREAPLSLRGSYWASAVYR